MTICETTAFFARRPRAGRCRPRSTSIPIRDPDPSFNTSIDYDSREARIDTVLAVSELFRLGQAKAESILSQVVRAVGEWRRTAADAGLDTAAVEQMARAFEHEEIARARGLVGSAADRA